MPASPSRDGLIDHNKVASAAVLNGVAIPAKTHAVLTARGVDVGELERRLRESMFMGGH